MPKGIQGFQKGHKVNLGRSHPAWNKGLTKETDERVMEISKTLTGKKLTDEHIKNTSEGHKGQKAWNKGKKMNDNFKKKCRQRQLGKKPSLKTRIKRSLSMTKEKEFNGFKSSRSRIIRNSDKIKIWRQNVFKRDGFFCQNLNCPYCNNIKGEFLHPHHIIPFVECIALDWEEEIFDEDNGITYCKDYHLKEIHKNG